MTSAARTNFPHAAIIAYLLTVAGIIAASFFPEQHLWGVNWYGYFDGYVQLAITVVALVIPVALFVMRLNQNEIDAPSSSGRLLFPLLAFLIIVAAGVAFYLFRAQTHFLGDGMLLLSRLEADAPRIRPWNPGIYFVLHQLHSLLGGEGPETALLTYRIISWSAGLVFALGLVASSARLFGAWRDRLLFTLGGLTGGYALLFFGYVENYPLFVLCVGLFALSGLLALKGELGRGWPILPMVVGGLFHPYSVIMLPGCLYLLLRDSHLSTWISSTTRTMRFGGLIAMMAILIGTGYYFYTASHFLRFALVPPVENQFTVEGYTLLSLGHLTDWLNLLFVLAPTLPLLVVFCFAGNIRKRLMRPEAMFLILLLLPSLVICFLFDPKLGMPRDWDMFGFAGVPLTLLFYYVTLDHDGPRSGWRVAVLGVALSLLILGPRVATQAMLDKSLALFDAYAAADVIKSRSGRFVVREYLVSNGREQEAERRRLADNLALPQEGWDIEGRACFGRGEVDLAMRKFRQSIRSDPTFYLSWANLGTAYASVGRTDSALICMKIADGLMPYNPDNYNNLGGVYYGMGDLDKAESTWIKAVALSDDNFVAVDYLVRLYQNQNRVREYDSVLTEVVGQQQAPLNLLLVAADRLGERSEYSAAARVYRRCLALGLDSTVVCARQSRWPQLEVINCED